jgi:hypothetical protein
MQSKKLYNTCLLVCASADIGTYQNATININNLYVFDREIAGNRQRESSLETCVYVRQKQGFKNPRRSSLTTRTHIHQFDANQDKS